MKHGLPIIRMEAEAKLEIIEGLGTINAERFINCVKNEHFDYTEWQRDLWKDKTIEDIHQAATAFYSKNNSSKLAFRAYNQNSALNPCHHFG